MTDTSILSLLVARSVGGTTLGRAVPAGRVQPGSRSGVQTGDISKSRLSSRVLAVQEGPFLSLIHVSMSSCTAVCVHLLEGLSSVSQHWETLLVPHPAGWKATCFVPHGLSKPCVGVDGALQGPEGQLLAQLFPEVTPGWKTMEVVEEGELRGRNKTGEGT